MERDRVELLLTVPGRDKARAGGSRAQSRAAERDKAGQNAKRPPAIYMIVFILNSNMLISTHVAMNQLQEIIENPEHMVAIIQQVKTSPQLCAPLLEQFLLLDAASVSDHFVLRTMDLGLVIFKMNARAVSDYRVIVERYVHLLKNFVQSYPEIVYK